MLRQQYCRVSLSGLIHQKESATDRIYICGGFNGQECMNSAEYFDPKTNQWTMIAPMRHRRSGVAAIAYHSCIYVLLVNGQIVLRRLLNEAF